VALPLPVALPAHQQATLAAALASAPRVCVSAPHVDADGSIVATDRLVVLRERIAHAAPLTLGEWRALYATDAPAAGSLAPAPAPAAPVQSGTLARAGFCMDDFSDEKDDPLLLASLHVGDDATLGAFAAAAITPGAASARCDDGTLTPLLFGRGTSGAACGFAPLDSAAQAAAAAEADSFLSL
jgi:hypothetical protein